MPVQAVALVFGAPLSRRLPGVYHRLCARLMGFDIVVRGKMVTAAPALFVGNHSSYLDIMVLGTVIDGCFVAKAEIAHWPLFGWLSKLQRTVFVERRTRQTARQRDEIGKRLEAGDRLILFPEGTSDDGALVLPFKSALFAVAEEPVAGEPLLVQPFSLAYTELDSLPVGREWRPLFAWYGDMGFLSHAWRISTFGRIRAELRFHEPVSIGEFGSRKALAEHCHDIVRDGVAAANTGSPHQAA
jgi:1-acyl-sn-glycerol-3-phosphate acyltransferase